MKSRRAQPTSDETGMVTPNRNYKEDHSFIHLFFYDVMIVHGNVKILLNTSSRNCYYVFGEEESAQIFKVQISKEVMEELGF